MALNRIRAALIAMLFAATTVLLVAAPTDAAVTAADISPDYQARPTNTFNASWTLYANLTSTHSMTFTFGDGQGVTYSNLPAGVRYRFPGHSYVVWCGPAGSQTYSQKLSFSSSSVTANSQTKLTKSGSWC